MLNSKGKIKSKNLAEEFNVSRETIRRNLQELENNQKLKRVYGGAVKLTYDKVEEEYFNREILNLEEKNLIGRKAAKFVENNDFIIIDEGTTTYQMLEYILETKNLTIFTPSFPLVSSLMDYKAKKIFDGDIIFIGGRVNAAHRRTSGSMAVEMMNNIHVDKAFIGTTGVLFNYGLSDYSYNKGILSKKFIEKANESIVMIDNSKIGVKNHYKFADLKDVDIIISDKNPPDDWIEEIEQLDLKWIKA
jgi:DeoR/GlpR family transcriptional regulator of sugar metabolism